jgi:HupE / UreJ protein
MDSGLEWSVDWKRRIPVPVRVFPGFHGIRQLKLRAVSAGAPERAGGTDAAANAKGLRLLQNGTRHLDTTLLSDFRRSGKITDHPLPRCMTQTCFKPIRSLSAALVPVLAFIGTAWSHPVPDLPVRSHFNTGGGVEIRVEVDPRCFEADPEAVDYFQKEKVESLSGEEVQKMTAKADVFVGERLRFLFDPVGELKPAFVWDFQKLGDGGVPFETDDKTLLKGTETVLVGAWKTNVVAGMTGYRIEALPMTPDKMGVPLNVMFLNFIGGRQVERYAVLFPGETSFTLDLTEQGIFPTPGVRTPGSVGVEALPGDWLSLFVDEVKRGFIHVIPEGLDHILFVLGVFLMTRKWKPLVLQVSAFTAAHTLTLWLAAAEIVRIPADIVEPLIAASIATIAIENVFHKRYSHWRLLVVFAFGLIHGLGFAGAMSVRLDSTASLVVGLLGVNVGVELGQLAVIAVALLATFWITDASKYRKYVVVPGSILIALAGIWWVIERTLL